MPADSAYEPAGHAVHDADVSEAATLPYAPAAHGAQPLGVEYEPAPQGGLVDVVDGDAESEDVPVVDGDAVNDDVVVGDGDAETVLVGDGVTPAVPVPEALADGD